MDKHDTDGARSPATSTVVVVTAVVLAGCGIASDSGAASAPATSTLPPATAPPTSPTTTQRPAPSSPLPTGTPAESSTPDGGVPDSEADEPVRGAVGTLVTTWTEARDPRDAVESLPERALLATEAERDEVVSPVADALDVADVMAVDLAESVVVLVSYADCNLRSRVVGGATSGTLRAVVEQAVAGNVQCVWAPLTVDAWEVPHAALGDASPTSVELRSR